jgi:hypothetical protein
MKQFEEQIKSESGVILMASTMGIFIILSLLAFYLARFAVTEMRTGGYHTMDIKTRNLAMTGLEHGIQSFKLSRSISTLTGSFNTGDYSVSYDTLFNEAGAALPYTNYITLKSKATINDVERNLRLIISTLPEAFCFSYYGKNTGSVTFNESLGAISGDMYHNGNVNTSIVSSGTIYNSTGSGGTQLSSPPLFPDLDITNYESLLSSAASSPGSYQNYALDFNSSDYVLIGGSSDINSGIHSQRTIEAWFRTNNKDSSTRQVIYEEGGGTRGLNIYIQSGYLYIGGWNRRTIQQGESNWTPGTWKQTSSIQSNQWHHVALTLNGGSTVSANALTMYLDGNLITAGNGSQLWGHNPANIGRTRNGSRYHNGTGNGYTFNGKIDEVRIWNIARTPSQIAGKKDTVLNGNETNLTAYYNFQENSGSTANDTQTQSNNDGTISGATWTSGPPLSKMSQSTYTNTTINLSTYSNNQLLKNGDLTLTNVTVNGPGYLAVAGDLTVQSNSIIKKNVTILCSGDLTMTGSQIGNGIRTAAVLYIKGTTSLSSSTINGLVVAKGSTCILSSTNVSGAILNYGSTFTLANNSDITGSVVSNYSVDIQDANSSIMKGSLPPFFGLGIGLDPMVVPGSYLEY